jgi:hypothetical protein
MTYIPKDKAWFMSKIGQVIFRDSVGKCCPHCDHVVAEGLTVSDSQHAEYLALTDVDFANDGYFLNYRIEK